MALDAKMIPSMQVDFSVSGHHGFECLVKHRDIERVTSNEEHIHISNTYTYHVLLQYWRTTALKFLLHQYKEAYAKVLQPKPLWKFSSK
jgi:hypothetical protein